MHKFCIRNGTILVDAGYVQKTMVFWTKYSRAPLPLIMRKGGQGYFQYEISMRTTEFGFHKTRVVKTIMDHVGVWGI